MPSTASQLERSLRKLQISESDSQKTSTAVQWVPSKYSSDVSQKELYNLGTIAFHHVRPGKSLSDNSAYIAINSLTFLEVYLGLRMCTLAGGKVVGDSKDIPSECVTSGEVLLLVLWMDTEREATCPTQDQVHYLKMKLERPPGWWVEIPNQSLHHVNLHRAKCLSDKKCCSTLEETAAVSNAYDNYTTPGTAAEVLAAIFLYLYHPTVAFLCLNRSYFQVSSQDPRNIGFSASFGLLDADDDESHLGRARGRHSGDNSGAQYLSSAVIIHLPNSGRGLKLTTWRFRTFHKATRTRTKATVDDVQKGPGTSGYLSVLNTYNTIWENKRSASGFMN
ncbi:uncharacterized protein F5891DRAFT_983471 [Suillus fuscotomentosus]|uniref:Uncharacterized protein n=1 Tax=Suillus fuscotomentosus TaxID=1912939 RepID=A0AAD4DZL2_9AGAM|nr:uncharacterized protein F5891DRAFT_983500 [Suillus fuscotomentosus]XP_041222052.1 uncharacterized protein F5891DRAFT_983471 [Suillus fuscotomentosus]KAG1896308.1 hypothetical protein F5891DRAFT_983500 [Suillus fuscotomentosus]KAG1896476.1 hypothetical protein F5891DRAFT_983471 [Suillus fuscotomentosus]